MQDGAARKRGNQIHQIACGAAQKGFGRRGMMSVPQPNADPS
jgi:hypothetical protein